MEQCTHKARDAQWEKSIYECQQRSVGTSVKQWIEEKIRSIVYRPFRKPLTLSHLLRYQHLFIKKFLWNAIQKQ